MLGFRPKPTFRQKEPTFRQESRHSGKRADIPAEASFQSLGRVFFEVSD
jgi:hypothetical protein